MKKQSKKHDELINEALSNAKADRVTALSAYEKMKSIFEEIDAENPETMQAVLLVGRNAVELIKAANASNEQIIKLAVLKEKEDARTVEEDEDSKEITLDEIHLLMTKQESGERVRLELLSEKTELEGTLDECSKEEVLDRKSIEARLNNIKSAPKE